MTVTIQDQQPDMSQMIKKAIRVEQSTIVAADAAARQNLISRRATIYFTTW